MESLDVLALLPPPPRRIRRRRGYSRIFGNHLSLVVVLLFACLFWQITVGVVRLLWFSTLVPAKVTKVLVTPGEPGPSYDLLITYRFDDVEYSEKINVGSREAEMLKEGDTVKVQVLPEHPDRGQLYQENYPYFFVTTLLCLFSLGPTVVMAIMLWNLYVSSWQLRSLLREGAAASAVIVDKKEVAGRPPTYTVTYEFYVPSDSAAALDPSASATVRASMKVPLDDFLSAQIPDRVMVLYRPERPRKSVIYRYADYEFADTGPAGNVRQTLPSDHLLVWPWVVVFVTAGLLFFGILFLLGWW